MAHSSNIPVSEELADEFSKARTSGDSVRWIQAIIKDERVNPVGRHAATGSITADWDSMVARMEPKKPNYFVFRLDKKNDLGFEWAFIVYVPDGSPVKDRMLYASSRDFFKKQLGYSYFADEMYGTTPAEFTWDAWTTHKDRHKYEPPKTEEEKMADEEVAVPIAVGPSTEGVHGVAFPVLDDARTKLKALASGSVNLVQLSINLEKEQIFLHNASSVDLAGLRAAIPAKEPCYSFYNWNHEHEGASVTSTIFIYSCPTGSKVKARMLYSSVKTTAAGACEAAGQKIDKKIEITDPEEELDEKDLLFICHPPSKEVEKKFDRPTRAGKGTRRLIRSEKKP